VSRSARTPRSRRWTAAVVGGAATGAVLLGGGIALADGSGSGSADAPSTDQAPGDRGPAGERVVGTVTAVSDSSLTVTDDTGAAHELTLSDETRYGGPGGGPGGPGRGPGGPGEGRPGPGGGAPDAPADGSTPAAPSDGSTPAAPSEGDAPTAPSEGSAPSDAPAPPADGSTPAEGDAPAPPAGDAPDAGSAADIAVGDRVEVRVSDGAALEVREVDAHVDGTVVSVDGTDLTVVTTPGLRVDVDAASLSELPAVGDEVHLHGSVTDDGRTVVADADR
jgi:hypothetical protein